MNDTKKNNWNIKRILWLISFKAIVSLPIIFCLILIFNAYLYGKNSHSNLCSLIEYKIDEIAGPLSRELILGQTNVANEVFRVFKDSLSKLNIKGEINLISEIDKISSVQSSSCNSSFYSISLNRPIYFLGKNVASIKGEASLISLRTIFLSIAICFLVSFISFYFWVRKISRKLLDYFFNPIYELSLGNDLSSFFSSKTPQEIIKINDNLLNLKNKLIEAEKANFEAQKISSLANLSAQVAHDIRSPLAALNMAIRDLANIPEEKRIIIRGSANRIQDIANDLLAKNRNLKSKDNKTTIESSELLSNQLITSLFDSIITEKRMQYRSRLGIEIEFNPDKTSYGLFVNIQTKQFKRVISNIINNSVEAFEEKGKIQVDLSGNYETVEIKIRDNGKGIPSEILEKLGSRGETYGKSEGNGLGLYHAQKSVKSWNGSFSLESEMGKGTTITIKIPKSVTPSWFVPELTLMQNGNVVILDDDSTIHQIWEKRFKEIKKENFGISVFHFSTTDQVVKWLEKNQDKKETVFLFDFELIGQELNGLELIKKLNIAYKSILVSSRFEEKNILEKCHELGVKLIPKCMAEYVPISINKVADNLDFSSLSSTDFLYDKVYIDNDKLLRKSWENSAKERGISLLTLSSTKEFEKYISQISKEATFYIDRELGDNEPKGEIWAKELFDMGYKNLYLATGYEKEDFPKMDWICDFIQKFPPWELQG